jgi:SAM-dependent methyltransferase
VDRKDYVKRWLAARISARPEARIADIACGPCRLEREMLDAGEGARAHWTAVDHDPEALNYARRVLGTHAESFEFAQENAVRLARSREVPPLLANADYVISLGLFDYLPRNISVGLLRTLRASVRDGGELLIGNYADSNPSQTYMDWVGDWPLIYRSRHDFAELFLEAGFDSRDLVVDREAKEGHIIMITGHVVK